ncbi:hypothetical protein D1610_11705 [Sphingomonas gilva]|uniref:DNA circulation N-terminal domain-containing protein n=1 Tax=Sphingomonas gilva TaxID=2305907 RepID=A0A396RLH7_9SPHN|nr:DNA circularization N-terminal domain-containing protein [Sphingomonas gilva]RHW17207.1 hypothetical protein D1610_11705 [Sphingomonas gilva]
MSWRDEFRPGSFRGVPFVTAEHELRGGRRVQTHEFPGRDKPFGEDLGKLARTFTIEVFVHGADYRQARDRLVDALEAAGAGTLVHPFLGSQSVNCVDFGMRESTDQGGMATFSIVFAESGAAISAPVAPDTATRAASSAETVAAAAPVTFAQRFDVSAMPAFVEDAATRLVRDTAAVAAIAGGLQGGAGPALHAFDAGLRLLPDSAQALVRSPLALGQAVLGMIHALGAIGTRPLARIAAIASLIGLGDGRDAPSVLTPARIRERDNATAWHELVDQIASAELVKAVAAAPLSSHADAEALRDQVSDLLEERILVAADAGDEDAAACYELLHRAMVADITRRGGTLARVHGFTPARTEPWLVIAQRLYGHGATLEPRAADLVARNRLRHPAFVPGGMPIEVIANG